MRKYSRLSGLCLCILTLCVCSCGGSGSSADPMGTGTVELTASATEVQPGGSCTLTATVTNRTSAGTTVPVIGEKVSFALLTANGGTLTAANDQTASGGVATAIYTAGNNMASDTVRVITDVGATASITITKTGGILGARISSMKADPTPVAGGGSSIVTATVSDGNGKPMQGETVTFTLPVNESGASFASSVSVTTDAGGNAVAIYRAGSISPLKAVSDTVRGSLANGSSNAVVITRSAAGTPTTGYSITVSPTAPTVPTIAGGSCVITANVKNNGTGVDGVTVKFTQTGGVSVLPASATTDGGGNAETVFSAGAGATGTEAGVVTASIAVDGNTYVASVVVTYP